MKVKELIESLQKLPQDDEIFVGDHTYGTQLLYIPDPKHVDILTNAYNEDYEVTIYDFKSEEDTEDYFTDATNLRKGWLL